jgi:hypothetical protein
VYKSLPNPGGTASSVAEALANRLTNLPELKVVAVRTESCAGSDAARVEVIAPGSGDAIAPSGTGVPVASAGGTLVPTHRVVVAIPRPADTLCLVWHAPESANAELQDQIQAILKGMRLETTGLGRSSY